MNQKSIIAVLGGGGRTGNFVVNELLNHGYSVKVLLRKPELFTLQDAALEIIKGDAIDLSAIKILASGSHAVISTIGQRKDEPLVAAKSTQNVLQAMEEIGIDRYISVAGINVDTPFDKKGKQTLAATEFMKAQFPLIQNDRQRAYSIISQSTIAWTLVRVPMIEFTDDRPTLKASLDDCMGTKITAGSIAKFIVQQLTDKTYIQKSPFIANE
jgi:putative NADH-flavin reductase